MFCFRVTVVDMLITVFARGRFCAVNSFSHILLVLSLVLPNNVIISELYPNFCTLAVRFSCSGLAFIFSFLAIAICAVLVSSLMAFDDICFSLFVNFVSDLVAAINLAVKAGGVPRSSPAYPGDEYIFGWFGRLDARRFAILPAVSTLTAKHARS